MENLQLAKKTLEEGDYTFVLVKDGEVIKTSKDKGIKPILSSYKEDKSIFKDAYIADRVIGRAAAIFLRAGQIKALDTLLISQDGLDLLEGANIDVSFNKKVEKILNRDMTDLCPMEKLSQGLEDPEVLAGKIFEFIGGKNEK